jgi:hypothetical protein
MQNFSLTRTNQKLVQARLLLESLDKSSASPVLINSIKEGAAFHLVCAYRHYLHEIAETYGIKNSTALNTEADLMAAFLAAKKHPVEVEELLVLRSKRNSWLGQLHRFYESLWGIPKTVAAITASEASSEGLIKLVDIESDPESVDLDLEAVVSWLKEFVALVERQRETSAEF